LTDRKLKSDHNTPDVAVVADKTIVKVFPVDGRQQQAEVRLIIIRTDVE